MEITIITLTVGLITYCFFRSIKAKSRVKKVELSDTDKEEFNKLLLDLRKENGHGFTKTLREYSDELYIHTIKEYMKIAISFSK